MIEKLMVISDGLRMGELEFDTATRHTSFSYDDEWRENPAAFPLSLSMPLTLRQHPWSITEPFLTGLLPDNPDVTRAWAAKFKVSRTPFHLLKCAGEDCAGAIQVLPTMPGRKSVSQSAFTPLSNEDIAERMKLLVRDHSAARTANDTGHFSLAGAKPKTVYYRDPKTGVWGVPVGNTPSTHIFKPATGEFDGLAENEHFCLTLARALGLTAVKSTVVCFGDTPVIVTERYDRRVTEHGVKRVHQEDLCQALGIMPELKYQNEGGAGIVDIVKVIRRNSSHPEIDVRAFHDALIFSWLTGNTDAHAKNYSLLLGSGQVRLAPLYDLASVFPYGKQITLRRAKLAMKVGGEYNVLRVTSHHWGKLAGETGDSPDRLLSRVAELTKAMPDATAKVAAVLRGQLGNSEMVDRLEASITENAVRCNNLLHKNFLPQRQLTDVSKSCSQVAGSHISTSPQI